jgi:inositol-1,3,4-trisphosphate 5/6-kinase / inositol-tetrakisphosphate 1-kinase
MSVVMAEASKVKLGLVVIDSCCTRKSTSISGNNSNNDSNSNAYTNISSVTNRFALTKARLMTHEDNNKRNNDIQQHVHRRIGHPGGVGGHIPTKSLYGSTQSTSVSSASISTISSLLSDNKQSILPSTTNSIHQLIAISTTTTTIPTTSTNELHDDRPKTKTETIVPIRLSFVPLDFNTPLTEQHSGKIDIILHKITEDIVSASTLSSSSSYIHQNHNQELQQQQQQSMERIQRLLDYNQKQQQKQQHQTSNHHLTCNNNHTQMSYLIDHPMSVRKVMCRADIANTLHECLHNIYTTSGISVGTPKYAILKNDTIFGTANNKSLSLLQQRIQHLSFPIIVKPLTAAGAKSSHAMTIIMDHHHHQQEKNSNHENDIVQLYNILSNKSPCLCQEYLNHDEVLYKVYVLGDYISVHQRRSLPNLPTSATYMRNTNESSSHESRYTYINFDSQRPYPHLSDFGYTVSETMQINNHHHNKDSMDDVIVQNSIMDEVITVDEVRPIVDALRQAFHLELFGFDILITTNPQHDNNNNGNINNNNTRSGNTNITNTNKMMLVVDVNYFPSYKEVSNFPTLLAQYLAQRAILTSIR